LRHVRDGWELDRDLRVRNRGPGQEAVLGKAFDARPADDRLLTGSEPHERLVAAVVVVGPEQERRLLAVDAAGILAEPFAVEPCAYEGVRAPLCADRRVFAVTGEDAGVRIEREQDVEDRVLELAE